MHDLAEFLHLYNSLWIGVHLDHILVYFFAINYVERLELLGGGGHKGRWQREIS